MGVDVVMLTWVYQCGYGYMYGYGYVGVGMGLSVCEYQCVGDVCVCGVGMYVDASNFLHPFDSSKLFD